jgi:hypothetical protein
MAGLAHLLHGRSSGKISAEANIPCPLEEREDPHCCISDNRVQAFCGLCIG